MFNFKNFYKQTTHTLPIDYVFYVTAVLLGAVVLAYLLLMFKISVQSEQARDLERKMLSLGSGDRQTYNRKIFDYKRKIDDFATLIDQHTITAQVFSFIEDNALSQVQFNNFNFQQKNYEVMLTGQTESMELVSRQIKKFESSDEYVKSITVLDAQSESGGIVTFSFNIMFKPSVFDYRESVVPEKSVTTNNNDDQ